MQNLNIIRIRQHRNYNTGQVYQHGLIFNPGAKYPWHWVSGPFDETREGMLRKIVNSPRWW